MPTLYAVCTCLLWCLMNLALSSRSWSFCGAGIIGSCRFFGEPVGVAVADLEANLGTQRRSDQRDDPFRRSDFPRKTRAAAVADWPWR